MQYETYIEEVLSGDIMVCEKVKLAVKRHVNDLKKAKSKDYPYYFDKEWADKYIEFIKLMKLHQGKLAGKEFPILPFQEFIVAMSCGWRHKVTKLRRWCDNWW